MVMNVSTAPATPAAGAAARSSNSAIANALETPQQIQDRFLTLLIAQLQNQDPLSPMDNTQITQQMSQLSMVQGIANLNSSMNALLASQTSQAAGLIGHTVLLAGNGLSLAGGQALGAARLAGTATQVQVDVLSAGGALLDTLELGPRKAGDVAFAWDGKDLQGNPLPDGSYTYRVRATAGGVAVPAETYSAAQVTSITLGGSGPLLDLGNGSQVALTAIKKIL
ncbi:MAG: flagellar hook assembly protein FlgD [Rhodocyclaceae bacterium]|nr:flagellar hook assembly protein FlgD [Rhodocyclaceae bacterium]